MNTHVTNLDAALEKHPEADPGNVQELLANIESVPVDIRTAVSGDSHFVLRSSGGMTVIPPQREAVDRLWRSKLFRYAELP
jgi:hypothetical protein